MTHDMRVLINRYTNPDYNTYCQLSVVLRHGLGPAQPEDEPIIRELSDKYLETLGINRPALRGPFFRTLV